MDEEYSQNMFGYETEDMMLPFGGASNLYKVVQLKDVMFGPGLGYSDSRPIHTGLAAPVSATPNPSQFNGLTVNESDFDLSPSFLSEQYSDSENALQQMLTNNDLLHAERFGVPLVGNIHGKIEPETYDQQEHILAAQSVMAKRSSLNRGEGQNSVNQKIFSDSETITLENWIGVYNFKVVPIPDSSSYKKCIYSEKLMKLYCKDSVAVPFKIELDYGSMPIPFNFKLRASLVFKDPDNINKPVMRCITHTQHEKRVTDMSKLSRLKHVLRPSQPHTDTEYVYAEESGRCYLLSALRTPEPGIDFATRSYVFTCLNSCKGDEGISRRPLALMFCLYDDEGNVLGRSFTDVRICSAPFRDHNKENNCENNGTRKRKSDHTENGDDNIGLPAPKRSSISSSPNNAHLSTQSASPRVQSVRCVITESTNAAGSGDDDQVSSSQETVYSCDETENKIQLRQLIREVRWALKLKKSDNPTLQGYSRNVYSSLKLTQELCLSARRAYQEVESQQKQEDGKSPDGGFHDGGVE